MAVAPRTWQTLWRWHFYAGLLVIPFVVVLSFSGALYLFKPQVERWEERAFHQLPVAKPVSPGAQVAAALAANPGARFAFYRLPERAGDAAMVHLAGPGGMRDVFVSPRGRVLGSLDPEARIIAWDRRLHGQLLLGRRGSWLVELAASWAIVLILTGIVLWWPRGRGLAGVLWPRIGRGLGARFWRDCHAVTGFWVSGLALVLLFTGLPWADAWGSAFKAVRAEFGWVRGAQDWTVGGRPADDLHAEHDHMAMGHMAMGMDGGAPAPATLDALAAIASGRGLAFPVLVIPPGMPAGEGGAGKPGHGWTIRSDAQDRPLRVTMHYDAAGERLLRTEDFAGKHVLDRIVGYGVAWHEGALLGWVNQLVGLMTAVALVTVAISGALLWWRRRPAGAFGAPSYGGRVFAGWRARIVLLALLVWLPLFAASLAVVLLLEWAVASRVPVLARWLGLEAR